MEKANVVLTNDPSKLKAALAKSEEKGYHKKKYVSPGIDCLNISATFQNTAFTDDGHGSS